MTSKLASTLYEDLYAHGLRLSVEDAESYRHSLYHHKIDRHGNISKDDFEKICDIELKPSTTVERGLILADIEYYICSHETFDRVMTYSAFKKLDILFNEIYKFDFVRCRVDYDSDELENKLEELTLKIFEALDHGVPAEFINDALEGGRVAVIQPDVSLEEFNNMTEEEKQEYINEQIAKMKGDLEDGE